MFDLQLKIWHLLQPRTWWSFGLHRWQRMRRGWSDRDAWNLDAHLARVIADGVAHLREVNFGHPTGTTFEEWQGILKQIAEGFRVWADHCYGELTADEKEAYVEAKRLFAVWHAHLWW
jgi:hypothetical protein